MQTSFQNPSYSSRNAFKTETSTDSNLSDNRNFNPVSSLHTAQRILFRKRDGAAWVKIVWHPSGALEGVIEKAGQSPQAIALKGFPSQLKPEHEARAKALLENTPFKLTDYTVEFLPGLRGGMDDEKKKSEKSEEDKLTGSKRTVSLDTPKALNSATSKRAKNKKNSKISDKNQTKLTQIVLSHNLNTSLSITYEGQDIEFHIHEVVKILMDLVEQKLAEVRRNNQGQNSVSGALDLNIEFLCNMFKTQADGTIKLDESIPIPENFEKIDIADFYSKCLVPKCTKIDSLNDVLKFVANPPKAEHGLWLEIGGRVIRINYGKTDNFYASDYGALDEIQVGIENLKNFFFWIPPVAFPFMQDVLDELKETNPLLKYRDNIEKQLESLDTILSKKSTKDNKENIEEYLTKLMESMDRMLRELNEPSKDTLKSIKFHPLVESKFQITRQTSQSSKISQPIKFTSLDSNSFPVSFDILKYGILEVRKKSHVLPLSNIYKHLLENNYEALFQIVEKTNPESIPQEILKESSNGPNAQKDKNKKQLVYNIIKAWVQLSRNYKKGESLPFEDFVQQVKLLHSNERCFPIKKQKKFIKDTAQSMLSMLNEKNSMQQVLNSIGLLILNIVNCAPFAKLNEDIQAGRQESVLRPFKSYGKLRGDNYPDFAEAITAYLNSPGALSPQKLATRMRDLLNGQPLKPEEENLSFLPCLLAAWFISEGSRNPTAVLDYLMVLDLLEAEEKKWVNFDKDLKKGLLKTELENMSDLEKEKYLGDHNLYSWENMLRHPWSGFAHNNKDKFDFQVKEIHGGSTSIYIGGGSAGMCGDESMKAINEEKELKKGEALNIVRQKQGSLLLEWLYKHLPKEHIISLIYQEKLNKDKINYDEIAWNAESNDQKSENIKNELENINKSILILGETTKDSQEKRNQIQDLFKTQTNNIPRALKPLLQAPKSRQKKKIPDDNSTFLNNQIVTILKQLNERKGEIEKKDKDCELDKKTLKIKFQKEVIEPLLLSMLNTSNQSQSAANNSSSINNEVQCVINKLKTLQTDVIDEELKSFITECYAKDIKFVTKLIDQGEPQGISNGLIAKATQHLICPSDSIPIEALEHLNLTINPEDTLIVYKGHEATLEGRYRSNGQGQMIRIEEGDQINPGHPENGNTIELTRYTNEDGSFRYELRITEETAD